MSKIRSEQLESPIILSGSFSGSFSGSGADLYDIPASGIIGLNLSQIAAGNITASVSDNSTIFNVDSSGTSYLNLSSTGRLTTYNLLLNGTEDRSITLGGPPSTMFGSNGRNLTIRGADASSGMSSFVGGGSISIIAGNGVDAFGGDVNIRGGTANFGNNGSIFLEGLSVHVRKTTTAYPEFFLLDVSGSGRFTDSVTITGSLNISGSQVALTGGSFSGSGANLYDIPASGIVGLNLSQIASGSVSASISPNRGLEVNTDTTITGSLTVSGSGNFTDNLTVTGSLLAPNITGSLFGTSSWAENAVTASYALVVDGGTY